MPWIWRILLPKSQTTRDFYTLVAQGETRMTLNFWQKIRRSQCHDVPCMEPKSAASTFLREDPALLASVERVLLSGTPVLCQFDVLNPVSTLISDSFLKQNGVPKSVEDRQTLQTASATERSIDDAAIKLLNPRIQNSSATKIQRFSIKQLTQSEYPKILQALQRSTNSPSNYVTPSIQNSFSCSKIHGFSTKDMSVHERATKSERRTNDDQRWGHSAFRGICWWKLGRKTVPHRRNALCRQNTRERKAGVFFAAAV